MNLLFFVNGFTITSWYLIDISAHLCYYVLTIHCKRIWYVIKKQKQMLGVTLNNKLNFDFATYLFYTYHLKCQEEI